MIDKVRRTLFMFNNAKEQKNAKLTCYLENKFKDETKPPMRECDKSRT